MRGPLKTVLLVVAAAALPALAAERQLQVAPTQAAPPGERRVALVIGNGAYKSAPLRNPVNDARAISKALAASGFRVTVLENGSQSAMRRAIRVFGDELTAGGVGLFYYAGHGMQVRGRNFLIPVNAEIEREDEIEDQAVDAAVVLSKMDTAKNALNLMILDACRNNPFSRTFRSSALGLAQMDAPSGTLVAFATAPGSVAADGTGDNGVYTKHLLANISRPGLPIEQVFKEVRRGVGRETGERQVPWESSSLRGDFFFVAPDPSNASEAQRREVERAVAEAVQREQAEMQRKIREMLAKQRAEMEEEMRRLRGEKSQPAAPAQSEPPVAAVSPAPAPVKIMTERLPKVGDQWEYRLRDVLTRQTSRLDYEVSGVSREGILETVRLPGSQALTRVHGAEPLMYYETIWDFAPYLLGLSAPSAGQRWEGLHPAKPYSFCLRASNNCRFQGRLGAEETVTVPAGTFKATRVAFDLIVTTNAGLANSGTVELLYWYSAEARRVVKATSRTRGFVREYNVPDYDFELVAYRPGAVAPAPATARAN